MQDPAGHGTHVAGILAGEQIAGKESPIIAATWYHDDRGDSAVREIPLARISGMAPRCKLLSCKVLRDDGSGDLAALLEALEYIQDLNHGGRELKVHGVNLSVGYPFDPSWFATGLTPVCREVDRLVRSGVLVVAAAGNTGYGYALDPQEQQFRLGFDMTINDPGNAERALTVGSTSTMPTRHRRFLLLLQGADWRRPDEAGPGRARRTCGQRRGRRSSGQGAGAGSDRHLRREFRNIDGRSSRFGGCCRIPIGAPGIRRPARGSQTGSARRGHRHWPFTHLSGAWHGRPDAGNPIGLRRWR